MTDKRLERFDIEHSAVARCSPERLMKRILDPATWPRWQPEILSAEGPPRVKPGAEIEGRAKLLGFVVEGRSTTIDAGDGFFEEDVVVGVRMRVRYEVRPADEGAVVIRTLSASLPAGASGRILSFFLKRRLRKMQVSVLQELVRQSEAP